VINALWVIAIAFALGFQSAPGLLAILCFFVLEGVIELKAIRKAGARLIAIFGSEPDAVSWDQADHMTSTIMRRIQADIAVQAERRPH
jgi:hypothetical protein